MNQILYRNRCKCNEDIIITKKRKTATISEGKPLQYPKSSEVKSKTFYIKYDHKLSLTGKFLLNSFPKKYIYYAIDDILYSCSLSQIEKNNLLALLYSPILSLHNNFSVNFFEIWIHEVYIDEKTKANKFIKNSFDLEEEFTYLTIKFFYKTKTPVKKQESLW